MPQNSSRNDDGGADEISKATPHICAMLPNGPCAMSDLDDAGGVPAIIKRARDLLSNEMTISGKSIYQIADEAQIYNSEVIRPLDDPVHATGGITVLYGKSRSRWSRGEECRSER